MILTGMKIYTENGMIKQGSLRLRNGKIAEISAAKIVDKNDEVVEFPGHFHCLPGFIDLHVHGANGFDVMDADPQGLRVISETLAREGVTSFLATTMTAGVAQIEKALTTVDSFRRTDYQGAEILGVHLEGPFISPKKAGAQDLQHALLPDINLLMHWQQLANQVIKLVTLAPELPGSEAFIQALRQQNIVVSLGHTDATYQEARQAITAGCQHATHLFNAMRGLHQREPGTVGAVLTANNVMAELIVDGEHVHPAMVELAVKMKGLDRLILVTDAMRAKCLSDGVYDLGGQDVIVKNNRAQLAGGTLAGSVLTLPQAIKNFIQYTGKPLQDVVKLVTENPARQLNIFSHKGSIAVGKDADLVVMDDDFNVIKLYQSRDR